MLSLSLSACLTDRLDIRAARVLLDNDHYAMEKLKKRVLEYLAVRQLKSSLKGPILCFVGPPGVGKTSVGRSVAKTLGREFHRIALGGVCDQSDIRGHRWGLSLSLPFGGAEPPRQPSTVCLFLWGAVRDAGQTGHLGNFPASLGPSAVAHPGEPGLSYDGGWLVGASAPLQSHWRALINELRLDTVMPSRAFRPVAFHK